MANGDADPSLVNGNSSAIQDGEYAGCAQEMAVLVSSNNNKLQLDDPSVPSDHSTMSSFHTPSQDSGGTTKRSSARPPSTRYDREPVTGKYEEQIGSLLALLLLV